MHSKTQILLLVSLLALCFIPFRGNAQQETERSLYNSPHLRFGSLLGGHRLNSLETLDVERIHLGWHVEHFYTNPAPPPPGIENVFVIHLPPYNFVYENYVERVTTAVQANPGAVWSIGNEMDRPGPFQNAQFPEVYAEIYYQLYTLIKSVDPTAQVSIGGIVQPTELRLRYLDIVWDTYLTNYGTTMPVDIWSIHNMILPETRTGFGAGIPDGIPDDVGVTYGLDDNDNIEIFKQQIVDFRTWMVEKGERDKPLFITEYGVLMPAEFGFGTERVIDFMHATFDYMLVASDETIGYPADDNRLVQRWNWYSLDDYYYDQVDPGVGFNGNLFDALTREITPAGIAFAEYTMPDGAVSTLQASSEPEVGEPVTLSAEITNHGLSPAKDVTVTFWLGDPADGGEPISSPQHLEQVESDYYFDQSQMVTTVWTPPGKGFFTIFVTIVIEDEMEKANNVKSITVGVVDHKVYLPLIME